MIQVQIANIRDREVRRSVDSIAIARLTLIFGFAVFMVDNMIREGERDTLMLDCRGLKVNSVTINRYQNVTRLPEIGPFIKLSDFPIVFQLAQNAI